MFRSSNPAFARQPDFQPAQTWDDLDRQGRLGNMPGQGATASAVPSEVAGAADRNIMSVQGTVNKTFFLLTLCIGTALLGWNITTGPEPIINPGLMVVGSGILGLVISLVCIFAPKTSPITAPLYALVEGFFVGGVSAFYAMRFAAKTSVAQGGAMTLNTGLIFNAALLTFGILAGLLIGYSTGVVRPGRWFRSAVVAGTIGVCVYGLIAMVASMLGSFSLASVYDPSNGGMVSVGFSLLLVALASGNLVLDFESIHDGVKARAPRYMEWYGAFGLLVTLVWLYLEVLRLLAKLRGSNE